MRNKKNFNNLFDSLCVTLLFIACLSAYVLMIWFGVVNPKEGTNPLTTLLVSTLIWVPMMAVIGILIVKGCYEYWVLLDDSIYSKKIFSRKVIIKCSEIEKVEKKIVPALILGTYKSESYTIYSKNKKIVILIDERKKSTDLDYVLTKYMN